MTNTTKVLLFLLVISLKIVAQNNVQGKVLNLENEPVSEALITVTDKNTNQVISTATTDTLGLFSLLSVPADFLLDVAAFGYEEHNSEVSLKLYADKILTVKLNYIVIDEVVVTANSKPRIKRDGNKMLIDKLENSPYSKGSDLHTFIRFIPILKVSALDGKVTLREKPGSCTVLLVNGKNISIPMEAYLKNIRVEEIERIEVVAYAMGEYKVSSDCGVINLILKKREDEGLKYNLSLQDIQYGRNSQNGTFSISHTNKNIFITSGIHGNNANSKNVIESDYQFYNNNLQTLENSTNRDHFLGLGGYLHMDYEVNKKHTIGMQLGMRGYDTDVKSTLYSLYKGINANAIDSTYVSHSNSYNPNKLTDLNANLNYTYNTDNKGSILFADIDYRLSRPKNYIHNIYNKMNEAEIMHQTDILQKSKTNIDSYGAWLRYIHVFTPNSKLISGISYYMANSRYDYKYEDKVNDIYVDDSNRSNCFNFDDHTFSVYSTLHHKWSDKLNMILNLKMDYYEADGEQKATSEKISRNEVNILPSIQVIFYPSDNHIFSFNTSISASHPPYYNLNPFKMYISPTTYRKGNPELKSDKIFSGNLNYNFFEDYSFTAFMMYSNNIKGDFTLTDDNNNIVIMPMNRGKWLYGAFLLSGDKTFFKNYLDVSVEVSYLINKSKSKIPNVNNQTHGTYGIDLDAQLILSKEKRLSIGASYSFQSEIMGISYSTPSEHSANLSLHKRFNNSNISVGIYKNFHKNNKRFYEQVNYGYTSWSKNYWRFNISYSIVFGNYKTRNVRDRSNSEMKSRIEK